ncbi:MAG TPA: hypothetical protein VK479_14700 [Micropepsaceae bacterium]|nr:hypothetical protein [Micropepsaceae bacterium]
MTKDELPNRRVIGTGLIAAGALAVSRSAQAADPSSADKAKAFATLPDWTGIWMGVGTTLFEQKAGAASLNANNPNARDFPPYKPEWEAAYTTFLNDVVKQEKFSDPLSLGYPGGMIRMMSPARGLQFVLRPEQVWIIYERPDVRYIYTDGRPFPPKDELWPTFEGYSIGHWEGDTLVVQTVSLRGGVPIDRTGAALSDEAHVVERIRKTDNNTLQSDITIEDPVAFTGPWKVTRRYTKRREQYPRMENVSSLENQRNPVVNGETKVILAGDADPSSPYPPDIRPFALAKFPFPR